MCFICVRACVRTNEKNTRFLPFFGINDLYVFVSSSYFIANLRYLQPFPHSLTYCLLSFLVALCQGFRLKPSIIIAISAVFVISPLPAYPPKSLHSMAILCVGLIFSHSCIVLWWSQINHYCLGYMTVEDIMTNYETENLDECIIIMSVGWYSILIDTRLSYDLWIHHRHCSET